MAGGQALGPRGRACGPWSVLGLTLCAWACQSYDAAVLDDRLRAATVDAYLAVIEEDFGGLAEAAVSVPGLSARYRDAAIAAERPEAFYGVLRQLLAELDDPHASLRAPARFWEGPVALPERVAVMAEGDVVWLAVPKGSVRTGAELRVALGGWLDGLEEELAEGRAEASAQLLMRSALAEVGTGAPFEWMVLDAIDGVPIESAHAGRLLLPGALGSVVEVSGAMAGEPVTLALFRNSGSFTTAERGAPQLVRGPIALARLLDPSLALPSRRTRRRPVDMGVVEVRRGLNRMLRRDGRPLGIAPGLRAEYGLDARVLRSPGGKEVAYLRLEDFQALEPEASEAAAAGPPVSRADLVDGLLGVMAELAKYDDWIVDLTGNPGGSWTDLGALLSFFVPESMGVIPHVGCAVREELVWGLIPTRQRVLLRQARADVPRVNPRNLRVLVDQDTASAGEITASALRGVAGAQLVGERTAGAEYVTGQFEAPDGSILVVGLGGGMLAPCEGFQGRGLEPDLRVELVTPARSSLPPVTRRQAFRLEALRAALRSLDLASP